MESERITYCGVDITNEVQAVLRKRRAMAVLHASKRLELAAKVGRERLHVEDREGGGYVQYMMDPTIYHRFGQRWGYGCWQDNDFIRDTLKKIPAARVVSRSKNARFGWRGKGINAEAQGRKGAEGKKQLVLVEEGLRRSRTVYAA